MKARKFTLKLNGKYFCGQLASDGLKRGFFSHGVAGSYTAPIEVALEWQAVFGGEIVEVIHNSSGGWLGSYSEKPYAANN